MAKSKAEIIAADLLERGKEAVIAGAISTATGALSGLIGTNEYNLHHARHSPTIATANAALGGVILGGFVGVLKGAGFFAQTVVRPLETTDKVINNIVVTCVGPILMTLIGNTIAASLPNMSNPDLSTSEASKVAFYGGVTTFVIFSVAGTLYDYLRNKEFKLCGVQEAETSSIKTSLV